MRVWLNLVYVGVLSTLAAIATASFPSDQSRDRASPPVPKDELSQNWDLSAFERRVFLDAVIARPPFSEARRPIADDEAEDVEPVIGVENLEDPLTLAGVFAAGEKRSALLRFGDADARLWVPEGATEFGVTIVRVTANGAEILRDGQLDWLQISTQQFDNE